jgi:glycosyltransferase involved in cell wall biosynthesis
MHRKEYEIIIVDDGSVDETGDVVKEYGFETNRIKYFKQSNKGPAAARNKGIRESQGEILVFTDDDCLPAGNWLETIQNVFDSKSNIAGVEGRTYTERQSQSPFTHQVVNLRGGRAYPTCNIAYKAEIVRKEGGFDENFPYPHNEDVDLAWRIMRHGPIDFCKEMLVYHPPRKEKLLQLIRRGRVLGSEFYLFQKFPEKYVKQRARNPWVNIYIRYIFYFKVFDMLSWAKKWKRPWYFISSITITSLQVMYLIMMIPKFMTLERKSKNIVNREIRQLGSD